MGGSSFFGPTDADVSPLVEPAPVMLSTPEPQVGIVPGVVPQAAPAAKAAPAPQAEPDIMDAAGYQNAKANQTFDASGATAESVVEAVKSLLEAAFKAQTDGSTLALQQLERRPEPAESWVVALLGGIAELVVSVGLGHVADLLVHALKLGEGSSDAVRDQVQNLAKGAGERIGPAGESRPAAALDGGELPADVGSERLIDQYKATIGHELDAAQATGRAQLILSSDALKRRPAAELDRMLRQLEVSKARVGAIAAKQQREVLFGWMRLSAATRLGARAAGEPQIPGANGADTADRTLAASPGLDGFVDIYISCPETLDGVKGCKVEHAVVNSHPSAVLAVKTAPSLLDLPVHRKVFIGSTVGQGGNRWAAPAFVLTPEGELEVMPGAAALAGIGAGRPVGEFEIAPWLDPAVTVPEDQRPQREALQKQIWLNNAFMGARYVEDLLAGTQPRKVIK